MEILIPGKTIFILRLATGFHTNMPHCVSEDIYISDMFTIFSEVPGSSLQPPGRLLRGSSPRVSSPARSLEPPRSPRRFQASPHPSSPLHLTVLRASPRRHGLDSPIRSKLEEIVDMESKRVGGSRSSHRTTAANSPLITTIHVDDEVSLNVSVDSDDVVLFDEEEDARHQVRGVGKRRTPVAPQQAPRPTVIGVKRTRSSPRLPSPRSQCTAAGCLALTTKTVSPGRRTSRPTRSPRTPRRYPEDTWLTKWWLGTASV